MEKSIFYQLSEEFEYGSGGDFIKTATIELLPPNMGCFKESKKFDQLITGAMLSAGKLSPSLDKKEDDADNENKLPKASDLKLIIHASQDISVVEISEAFKILAEKVCKLDKDTFIIKDDFDDMEIDDFMNLICEYAANFTFPSLLKEA